MAEAFIEREFESCVHVGVRGAKSERSAVMLARNFAARHYGRSVCHYVSSGGSSSRQSGITWTYVFSNPARSCTHEDAGTAVPAQSADSSGRDPSPGRPQGRRRDPDGGDFSTEGLPSGRERQDHPKKAPVTASELLEFLVRECGYTPESAFETVGSLGTGDARYAFATDIAGTEFYIGYAGTAESPDQFTVTDHWR